jgi:2-methylcitrate dehydratase PrpD
MKKVEVQSNEKLIRHGERNCPAARVTVRLHDGKEIQKAVNIARGNPGNPLSSEELESKFHRCALAAGLSTQKAERLLSQLVRLKDVSSVGAWMRAEIAPFFRELKLRREAA